jgi:hypothetical protein
VADTHTYTLTTYNKDGVIIAVVSVSCSCPIGKDHGSIIKP